MKCAICDGDIENPVTIIPCGHTNCSKCVMK